MANPLNQAVGYLMGRFSAGAGPTQPIPLAQVANALLSTGRFSYSEPRGVFYYTVDGTQNIAANTVTKVQFNTKVFDTTAPGAFSPTLFRFQPTIAGYYRFTVSCNFSGGGGATSFLAIYLNGHEYLRGQQTGATTYGVDVDGLVPLNGSTDYVEIWIQTGAASNLPLSDGNYFQGELAQLM